MSYTEIRRIQPNEIRKMCIENNFYEQGTNEDYSNMLINADLIDNVTTNDIFEIAKDIYEHSTKRVKELCLMYGETENEMISHIMFNLINDCCYTFLR